MKKLLLAAVLLLATPALAQNVQQSGSVTRNHIPVWVTSGVIGDGGSSADSPISSIGVTNNGGSGICVNSARQTAPAYNALCLGASTTGPATISLQNFGTAAAQNLQFVINGTPVVIPTGGTSFLQLTGNATSGHLPCFSGTIGLVVDCGTSIGAGTQFGLPYYSTTSSLGSTGAGTSGQMLVGQTSSVPLWKTLSGDVGAVSGAGAVTLQSVNGVPFSASYGANGVLIGEGTNAFHSVSTLNVGQCLLSQGASDPIWSSCASGSGSAGGSNTQVQFNNITALGGSPNLTWVSPALTIGVAGTTGGQLQLAPAGSVTGTVTMQNPSATAAYNFNLPTAAGSTGQPLLSGGGGSTAMSFGTLGVGAGGTACTSASGTCLDNITGFASTGFVQRTGAGSYTFSLVVPVSGGGTGLANGTSGGILGFTGTTTIASSSLLGANGVLIGGGSGALPTSITACTNGQLIVGATSAPPACQSVGGDISALTSGGSFTIANSAVSNAKLANAAAYTFKGNATGSSAAPTDFTPGSLTNKASPAAGDYIVIADNAAAGALKYATVSSVASAGSVSSIAGNTGSFTLSNGITNSVNDIRLATISNNQILSNVSGGTAVPSGNNAASIGASKVLIRCQAASSSASIVFNNTDITSSYTDYEVWIDSLEPATDTVSLFLTISDDNGSTYKSSSYQWVRQLMQAGSTSWSGAVNTAAANIALIDSVADNNVGRPASGKVTFFAPGSASSRLVTWKAEFWSYSSHLAGIFPFEQLTTGLYTQATAAPGINNIKFAFSAGNIAIGNFCMYASRNS